MAEVYVFSLKVGTSHGLWQFKFSGSHERVIMHSLRHILDKTCQLLGYDRSDRLAVYLFSFSAAPFPGHQVRLEKLREANDQKGTGCYYEVKQSNIGTFAARGFFPAFVNTNYLGTWPTQIYFKLEKSVAAGIIN
jgi:hypothetical protein